MSFADIEIKFNSGNFEKARRTEFMSLTTGAHTVRILQNQAKTVPIHFFNANKVSVLCLSDECPVCANNKKLIMQFPENFREQHDYNKINYRFYVNVLDKTPAKVCGKCQKEYKNLAMTICTCGEVLNAVAPLNKIKVMSKGLTLRDDLDSIDKAIQSPNGEPVGLTNYDMVLMVSGTGRDTKVTPVPRTEANEPFVLAEGQELFDLEKCYIALTPSEMLDAQRGVQLKDIFAGRRASKQISVEPVVPQETLDQVNEAVNKLFNQ
jgi:hypothetical protein